MASIEVIETKPQHIRELSKKLQAIDVRTAERLGLKPHVALWRAYKKSLFCRTAFINGELVAIWGVVGTFLGPVGYPWLIMSPVAQDFPLKVAFRYRKELKEMLKLFPKLVDMVDAEHAKSLRLLKIMGFTLSEAMPFGKNGEKFIKAELWTQ